jgi:prepilin-type N-terminal cleavage/methylation domain-containing protein
MSPNKGFTLIELLVVISIIGVLSSIVMTSVSVAREKATNTKLVEQARQVRDAMQEYRNSGPNNGAVPAGSYTQIIQALRSENLISRDPDFGEIKGINFGPTPASTGVLDRYYCEGSKKPNDHFIYFRVNSQSRNLYNNVFPKMLRNNGSAVYRNDYVLYYCLYAPFQ